jgi:pimeloyl-ACP methyl ester carboxylesterase
LKRKISEYPKLFQKRVQEERRELNMSTRKTTTTSTRGMSSPIVFLPGLSGSTIVTTNGGEQIWPALTATTLLRSALDKSGNDMEGNEAVAGEVMKVAKISFITKGVYDLLFEYFENNGYKECTLETDEEEIPLLGRAIFGFPYDWRKDLRLAAKKLGEFIEGVKKLTGSKQVVIIAHSMGSLVALYYLTLLQGGVKGNVEKVFLIGPPINGAPKAFASLRYGMESPLPTWLPFTPSESQFRTALCNMPGLYMMLPTSVYDIFFNQGSGFVLKNGKILPSMQAYVELADPLFNMAMLKDAQNFHNEIYTAWDMHPFDELYLLLGRYQDSGKDKTISLVHVEEENDGSENQSKVVGYTFGEGDGTVTKASDERLSLDNDIADTNKIFFDGKGSEHLELARNEQVFKTILSIITKD